MRKSNLLPVNLRIKWITKKTKTFLNLKINVYIQLVKYITVFAVVEKLIYEKLLEMWKPDGTSRTCHQKNQTPLIVIAT